VAIVLAAAITPLADGGGALDDAAFAPYADFLADAGVDGVFVLGTTGEGILLSLDERRAAAERWIEAAAGRLRVLVHCGAQTTADTAELAAHAASAGADGVGVIPPPYYPLDARALVGHFRAAAEACAPCPFYLYEFQARSGYAIPLEVVDELRATVPNLAGLKVSDTPFAAVEPYFVEGLELYVGNEPLLPEGLARGATGTVSGLAAGFPEAVVALVRGDEGALERVNELRTALQPLGIPAAMKAALAARGVPLNEHVRAPLRMLTPAERAVLEPLAGAYVRG